MTTRLVFHLHHMMLCKRDRSDAKDTWEKQNTVKFWVAPLPTEMRWQVFEILVEGGSFSGYDAAIWRFTIEEAHLRCISTIGKEHRFHTIARRAEYSGGWLQVTLRVEPGTSRNWYTLDALLSNIVSSLHLTS